MTTEQLPADSSAPLQEITIDQQFIDRIVARAQNSMMSLGASETSYDLSKYDHPNFESAAILLVTAHHDKYDLVSLMCAAMEEVWNRRAGIQASEPQDSEAVISELANFIFGTSPGTFNDRVREWLTRHGFVWRDTAQLLTQATAAAKTDAHVAHSANHLLRNELKGAQTALAASQAEAKALREALDDLLNTSAVITPHDAVYKDDFVDLQVRGDHYEAAYDLLKRHEDQK